MCLAEHFTCSSGRDGGRVRWCIEALVGALVCTLVEGNCGSASVGSCVPVWVPVWKVPV
jgi:hypothetical protein